MFVVPNPEKPPVEVVPGAGVAEGALLAFCWLSAVLKKDILRELGGEDRRSANGSPGWSILTVPRPLLKRKVAAEVM